MIKEFDILSDILKFTPAQLESFILIICRMGGIFLDAPFLSNRNIPSLIKIGLLLFLSFTVFPFVKADTLVIHSNNLLFFFSIIKEIAIGLVIGFAARLLFAGIQIAGQLMDYQMGFGFVNVVDPESRLQVPIMGQFLYILGLFIFLLINGHHWIIRAVVRSFQVIPLDGLQFNPTLTASIVKLTAETFVIGFKISAPIVLTLFLVDLAQAVIARTVPQANIMVIGFPLKIGLGLFFAVASLPIFFMVIKRFFVQSLLDLNLLLKLM